MIEKKVSKGTLLLVIASLIRESSLRPKAKTATWSAGNCL